jgi:hypothetical protein
MSQNNLIVWQHLTGSAWQSFGTNSSNIETAFCSSLNEFTVLNDYQSTVLSIDFTLMVDSISNESIRRVTSVESPTVIYEWEEILSQGDRIWTAYNTDECEAISATQRNGRDIIVLYLTHNVPYEINLTAKTQTNKVSGYSRWIRKAPQMVFSASPAAVAPSNAMVIIMVIIEISIMLSFCFYLNRYFFCKFIRNPSSLQHSYSRQIIL